MCSCRRLSVHKSMQFAIEFYFVILQSETILKNAETQQAGTFTYHIQYTYIYATTELFEIMICWVIVNEKFIVEIQFWPFERRKEHVTPPAIYNSGRLPNYHCIHIYTYMYTCTFMSMCVCYVCSCLCMYVCVWVRVCVCMYMYVCVSGVGFQCASWQQCRSTTDQRACHQPAHGPHCCRASRRALCAALPDFSKRTCVCVCARCVCVCEVCVCVCVVCGCVCVRERERKNDITTV